MSLAAKLPYTHAYAGGYPSLGSQPLPTDSDCLTYLAAVAAADGAGVEVGVATAVDEFFRDTKAAGVFDALKACCILCGARTITGALVPLAGTTPTAQGGWASGDYSRTAGMTGNGSSLYLDSNRASDDDPEDDAHWSIFPTSLGSNQKFLIGDTFTANDADANGFYFNQFPSISAIRSRRGAVAGNDQSVLATIDAGKLIAASRQSSSEYVQRYSGGNHTATVDSYPPANANFYIFARRASDGSAELASNATIAFYSIGTDIGSAGLAALDTAVTTLITAIGNAL